MLCTCWTSQRDKTHEKIQVQFTNSCMNWLLSGIMDKKNKARRTNPIEVYKYLRFTENAKSLAVEEEKKKNW